MESSFLSASNLDRNSSNARLLWLDLARTLALAGMVVFHFVWDLRFFGLLPAQSSADDKWSLFATVIAALFLFISGISLWLAQGDRLRLQGFLRRFVILCAAAALISIATYLILPGQFVRFGILHCIALSSVIGVICLRLPTGAILALAVLFLTAPEFLASDVFNTPWLLWLGLSTRTPPAVDYIPVLPWAGWFLLGLAGAKQFQSQISRAQQKRIVMPAFLLWPGQHSLIIYLLHQPVLLGLIWGVAAVLN